MRAKRLKSYDERMQAYQATHGKDYDGIKTRNHDMDEVFALLFASFKNPDSHLIYSAPRLPNVRTSVVLVTDLIST